MKTIKLSIATLCLALLAGCTPEAVEPLTLDSSTNGTVRLREATGGTFDEKLKPLYVIDGVIVSQDKILDLDPDGIHSIQVMKGKSALAIYGDNGKNGVVLITMKK